MAEVTMPRLSDTMEEGTIASWLKKPGDQVSRGEVIAQIETDKATMDLTAFEAGTLQEILAPEGTTVQIGKPVARIGAGGGAAPARSAPQQEAAVPADAKPEEPAAKPAAAQGEGAQARSDAVTAPGDSAPAAEAASAAAAPGAEAAEPDSRRAEPQRSPESNGKVRASPVARHIAAEHGIDLTRTALALGTKPPGEPQQPQPAVTTDGDEKVQLSQMRRTIARRMAESTRTVPHFFLTVTVDATELVKLRKQIVDQGVKVSFNDLAVKGAALALRKMPEVNVSFAEDSLIKHGQVHIGIAVATERGLIVPVIRNPDQKSVSQIAQDARDLAERAQAGKLQPNDYTGGTFTVSNLGMFGIEQFNAVINPPEAAILAVGAIVKEPAEHEGEIALRDRMRLTLSVDHRALDGATGARYLQTLKELLEKPLLLLV
jgi:pyruvate dehydrogenase E2 component (dihydrolipoamide acetyltransferase)